MIFPLHKRMEEYKNRNDLFKVTMDRFANYTKEVEKIKSRKNWIENDVINSVRNLISDEKSKID